MPNTLFSMLANTLVKKFHQYHASYLARKDLKARTVKFSTWLGNERGVSAFAEAKAIYQPETDCYELDVKYSKLGASDSLPMKTLMTRPEFEEFYRRFA